MQNKCLTFLSLHISPDVAPTSSTPFVPSPVLSVLPSTGVKLRDMLSFRCAVPSLELSQSQHQSSYNNEPVKFLLLQTAEGTEATSIILQAPASQEPELGVFSVGPVTGGEEGEYICLYQIYRTGGLVNSTVSNKVQITVIGENAQKHHPLSPLTSVKDGFSFD